MKKKFKLNYKPLSSKELLKKFMKEVFMPCPPYNIGDLWTDGNHLLRITVVRAFNPKNQKNETNINV